MNDLAITYIKKIQDLLDADEEILIDKNYFLNLKKKTEKSILMLT